MSAARAARGLDSEHDSDDDEDAATKVASRQEARLLVAEYCEVKGANMVTTARSLQSLVFQEDTVARWRAQYAAAGEFVVPSVADLGEPRQKPLLRPTAIPRGRGAPLKKRKGGRRDAVLRYAKKFRREHGDEAEAVLAAAATHATASGAAQAAPRGAASGGAPAAAARRGTRVGPRGGGRGRRS